MQWLRQPNWATRYVFFATLKIMPNPNLNDDDPLTWYLKIPWPYRLGITIGILTAVTLIVAPWNGKFYPEGNWLFGPLWLLLVRHPGEKLIGAMIAMVLFPAIGAVLFRPGVITVVISLLGFGLWVGFGVYLAILAVA